MMPVTRWERGATGESLQVRLVSCPVNHPKLTHWPKAEQPFIKPWQQLGASFGTQSQLNKMCIPNICCFYFKWSVVSEMFCAFWNVSIFHFFSWFANRKPWNSDSSCNSSYQSRLTAKIRITWQHAPFETFFKIQAKVIGLPYQPYNNGNRCKDTFLSRNHTESTNKKLM